MPGYKVQLVYFKASGKYYSSGSYCSHFAELWNIWEEVRCMHQHPGLCCKWNEGPILVTVPQHPHSHPRLIMPGEPT